MRGRASLSQIHLPPAVALGSMGAGGIGGSLSYQQTADFVLNVMGGGIFVVNLLGSNSLGTGFDSATFQILLNGTPFESQSFSDLASAQAFFSSRLLDVSLAAGLNDIQLAFNESMSGGQGFAFIYAGAGATPLRPSWTMILMGLVVFGLIAHRRQKKSAVLVAAA
jgi:hypothetical protein